jgi:hypothetical protein
LFVFSLALLVAPLWRAQLLPGAQPGSASSSAGNAVPGNKITTPQTTGDSNPGSNQPQMIDRIVAVVEDDIILQSDLDQAMQTVQQRYASDPQKLPPHDVLERQVLNQLILMKLQVQHANDQGIRVSQDEVSNAIDNIAKNNHMSAGQMRQQIAQGGGNFAAFQQNVADQILVSKLRNQVVQSKVQVTDAEVDNMLKNPHFSMGKAHLAHIEINLPEGASPEDIDAAQAKADEAEKAIKDGNRDAERRARRLQNRAVSGAVSQPEHELLQEFQDSLAVHPAENNDLFLSYTRLDGWQVAGTLYEGLREHGVTVWFDERAMRLGQSQSLQMDRGLTNARGGVVLLTPAYLEGRFWPERELAALLHKPTVIPVLHNVTFGQVAAYSAILGDLHGLSTEHHTPSEIAALITDAVLDEDAA